MSSAAAGATGQAGRRTERYSLILAGGAAAFGLLAFSAQLQGLVRLWINDPLRSAGMLVPITSVVLAWRAWRGTAWDGSGCAWGLVLAVAAMACGLALDGAQLVLGFHGTLNLLPAGVLLAAYVSGVVLYFWGTRVWTAARFPILLLSLTNPVPQLAQRLVDLPLQAFAARVARAFAALIGVPVSPGTLRMMFAPDLGMFIAPGCDGLRGAVAMGMMALVLAYLYRLRLGWRIVCVAGAVLLAYAFNLLRLCCVVIYYWLALRLPGLGAYGTEVDYAIGATLFCAAAVLLLGVPPRLAGR
jgi:exosortase J